MKTLLYMKHFSIIALMALFTLVVPMSVSCDELPVEQEENKGDSNEDNNEDNNEVVNPGDNNEPVYSSPGVIEIEGDEYPVPNPRFPFDIYNGMTAPVVLDDDAVSVEVTEVGTSTIKFVCRPGANVASYVIDIWPLAYLYNTLLDSGAIDKNSRELESRILDILFTPGSGGYSIDNSILGEDYSEYEYDWANTSYAQYNFVPDAQYVIGIAACYEKNSALSNVTALTLVYVETDDVSTTADPALTLNVKTGFTAYLAEIIPNSDCNGYYYIDTQADMVDDFVNVLGHRALRDLMRHWWYPNLPKGVQTEQDRVVRHTFTNPNPDVTHTIVALAVDKDGKPADNYVRQDFNLKPVDEDVAEAEISVTIDPATIGASYVEYDVTLEANTPTAYHLVIPKAEADALIEAGEEAMAAKAQELKAGAYGINNYNFKYSDNFGIAESKSYSERQVNFLLKPDTEYVVAYCGLNYAYRLSSIRFSDPFTTLPRDFSRPQDCKADLELTFTDVDIASVKFNFRYNPEYTASYRFMCIEFHNEDGTGLEYAVPADDAPREEWIELFYERASVDQSPEYFGMNIWERDPSGYDWYVLPDLPIGKKTRYAYMAEDIYGVVSDVMFADFTTLTPQGGPDPTMELKPVYNTETGLWTITYTAVKDVVKFTYALIDQEDPLLSGNASILQAQGYPIDYYNAWKSGMTVGNRGLETYYRSTTQTTDDPEKLYLALCIAYGVDADGQECRSKLYYWLLAPDGKARLLSDIWPKWKEKDSL